MDGVLVAYHNTEQMFGFQYISLEEMDRCLFNSKKGTDKGDKIFGQCITILEDVSERIIACFPGEVSLFCDSSGQAELSSSLSNVPLKQVISFPN